MVQLRVVVESAAEVQPLPQMEELLAAAAMALPAAVHPAAIPAAVHLAAIPVAVHPAGIVQLLVEEQVLVAGTPTPKMLLDAAVLVPVRVA